jgi:DNA polymerase elongation subunit (family B)
MGDFLRDVIFCDTEVYAYDWLVCYKFKNGEQISFHNDRRALIEFVVKHKDDITVGYNIRHYDQYIIQAICAGVEPKFVNDQIIKYKKRGWEVLKNKSVPKFVFFDVMTEQIGLKKLEAHMGLSIIETSVPFDIDRPLTEEELAEVEEYCWADVNALETVFYERIEEFKNHALLINKFDLPISHFKLTKAQLVAEIVDAKRRIPTDDEFEIEIPENLRIEKYHHVVDWFLSPESSVLNEKGKPYRQNNFKIGGVNHTVAWGGMHSTDLMVCWRWSPDSGEEKMLVLDVKSYYPTIIILYHLMSRAVENIDRYVEAYWERLELKAKKDPVANALKVLLNTFFGTTIYEFSKSYDPRMGRNICAFGQLFLLDLLEKLEPYCKPINSNTDGLCIHPLNADCTKKCMEICEEWQKRTGFELEFKNLIGCFQRDVNSYIWVTDEEENNVKAIGAFKLPSSLKCDLGIIPIVLQDYFVHGILVNESISANKGNLQLFQRIVSVGEHEGFIDEFGKDLPYKVIRWFPITKPEMAVHVKWKKDEKGDGIPNVTSKGIILNGEILGKKCPEWLDFEYYARMCRDQIKEIETSAFQKTLSDW